MARRKSKKPVFENAVIKLSTVFTCIMGVLAIALDSFSWIAVFAPLVVGFVIISISKMLKSAVRKL